MRNQCLARRHCIHAFSSLSAITGHEGKGSVLTGLPPSRAGLPVESEAREDRKEEPLKDNPAVPNAVDFKKIRLFILVYSLVQLGWLESIFFI